MIATLAGLHTKFGFVPGQPRVLPLHAPPDLQSHCGRRHIDAYDLEHPDLHFHGQADTVYVLWRRHDGIDFGSLVEDVGAKPRHIPEYPRGCAVMATSMASNPATRAFAIIAMAATGKLARTTRFSASLAPCLDEIISNHSLPD